MVLDPTFPALSTPSVEPSTIGLGSPRGREAHDPESALHVHRHSDRLGVAVGADVHDLPHVGHVEPGRLLDGSVAVRRLQVDPAGRTRPPSRRSRR